MNWNFFNFFLIVINNVVRMRYLYLRCAGHNAVDECRLQELLQTTTTKGFNKNNTKKGFNENNTKIKRKQIKLLTIDNLRYLLNNKYNVCWIFFKKQSKIFLLHHTCMPMLWKMASVFIFRRKFSSGLYWCCAHLFMRRKWVHACAKRGLCLFALYVHIRW